MVEKLESPPPPGHGRAVVIGGGIAGASVLYHLAELGWTDSVLVERDELTSGSTWHAAAQVTQFGGNQTMVALKQHSIALYRKLAADPAHPVTSHITGGMRTAYTQDQLDNYHHYVSQARSMGVEMEVIDAAEVGRRHPLLNTDGMLGAWWDPLDGDIDPAGITFALARKAREAGCTVSRFNSVVAITQHGPHDFTVHTERGDIRTENVVNAGGYRCNEVGAMLGVTHPVVSMEHMYFLTETIPAIEQLDHRVPIIRDPGDDFYSRQEKNGLLVGVYEQACVPFGLDGIDPDFTKALCPSDLDRCLDNMERIFERMPALQETGIHTVVNGPITYTVDGLPLVGPVPGVQGYFACTGLRAGIGEGGGHGKVLAEIMVHGECEWDAWSLDPRRFTHWANLEHTRLKAIEDYQREFHYHLPHEHRPAARKARTTPLYDTLTRAGAVWGVVNGWERALYFDPDRQTPHGTGYRWHAQDAVVQREVAALSESVGLMEVSGFNRMAVSGPGAEALLDRLVCGRIPRAVGRVSLCYLLNEHGHLVGEATVAKLGDQSYWYGSAAAAEWHDRDWLRFHAGDDVRVESLATSHTTLVLAGPRARELLAAVSPREDWTDFRMMSARRALLGTAEVTVMRISFSGELAFELHVENAELLQLWHTLVDGGKDFGLSLFGLEATESMRLEKGYLHWKAEIITERTPFEAGLDRFVTLAKPDFLGREAAVSAHATGPEKCLVTLRMADKGPAPAHGGASVWSGDALVGSITSAGYGYRVDESLAMAYVDAKCAAEGTPLSVDIIGEKRSASVVAACRYDPSNERVRA
ncbi:MAG: FAD-dependent oxidoreductase [Pseudomonadota bacterium]